jgi:protein HOOK3
MSRSEQEALLAYFNTFKLARRVNTFASLADGKALMEVSPAVLISYSI